MVSIDLKEKGIRFIGVEDSTCTVVKVEVVVVVEARNQSFMIQIQDCPESEEISITMRTK